MQLDNNINSRVEGLTKRSVFTVFFACLLVVSMTFSPFLLSISIWGFVAAALWNCAVESGPYNLRRPAAWLQILAASFRNFFQHKYLILLTLLFFVPAFSYFWSADHHYWLERTRVRIPFFVLPWAFANLPRLTLRQLQLPLYVLVWVLVVICAGAAINFALHFDDTLAGIGRGQPVAVPRSHIRFSLMLATGIAAGGWLWWKKFYWRRPWERPALAAALIFLTIFIHVLSVRSGLAALYAALLFSAGWLVWRTRRRGLGIIVLTVIVLAPAVAIKTIPSFRMRINYMLWDWQQYRQNAGNQYSDSERWISLQVGWQLWLENPVLGTGAGDLPAEVERVTHERYPEYKNDPKLPHNQFVYILAGTGIAGLILSLAAFLAPVVYGQSRRFYLFSAFQIIIFTSFLVEYTIETAIGVAFYLFYTLWFKKMSE